MNTKTNWLTTATIHDARRAGVWGSIFPGAVVPIKSILPGTADLPGHPRACVYFLDLEAISDEQRAKLVEHLAALFAMTEEEVTQDLPQGVPILADDVSIQSSDPGLILSLMDGFDETGQALPGWEEEDPDDEDPALAGTGDWDDACDCDLCLAARYGGLDDDD